MSTALAELRPRHLAVEVAGGIGWILLDRPPVNALHVELIEELVAAVRAARFDPAVRVAVIGSKLPGYFSSGLDIREMDAPAPDHLEYLDHLFKDGLIRPLRTARKLFVALIDGHCLGGGLELALATDLRLATAGNWRIGLPEARLGGMPGGGGIQLLSRLVGPSRTLRLTTFGEPIDVETAAAWGLVDSVLEAGDARERASAYLQRLVDGPGEAIGAIKLALYEGLEQPLSHALLLERELYRGLLASDDLREGLAAFREKRTPRFGAARD